MWRGKVTVTENLKRYFKNHICFFLKLENPGGNWEHLELPNRIEQLRTLSSQILSQERHQTQTSRIKKGRKYWFLVFPVFTGKNLRRNKHHEKEEQQGNSVVSTNSADSVNMLSTALQSKGNRCPMLLKSRHSPKFLLPSKGTKEVFSF